MAEGSNPEEFTLNPPGPIQPNLHFKVVRDDLARGVLHQSGRSDVLFDTLSLSKTGLFQRSDFPVQVSRGFHLSYLGFNLKNPILSRPEVRRALSQAFPVSMWIKEKYLGFVEPLPGFTLDYDPNSSNRALDRAELPILGDGSRFTLRYLTTPVREGFELALLVREALKQVHVQVEIIPLEPSLFFSKLRRSDFEIFGSRIPRSAPSEPVFDFFKTDGRRNYFSYSDPRMDLILSSNPMAGFEELIPRIREDLPILPLFTWNHGLLLSKRIRIPEGVTLTADDSFRFLALLRLN